MATHTSPQAAMKAAIAAMKAAIREIAVCDECGEFFQPWKLGQRFCSASTGRGCNRKFHSREQSRGATLLPIAMAWRVSRGEAKDKFAEMCRLIDGWHFDDRKRRERHAAQTAKLETMKKKELAG